MKYICKGQAVYLHELRSRDVEIAVDAEDRNDAKFLLAHSNFNTSEYNVHLDLRTIKQPQKE